MDSPEELSAAANSDSLIVPSPLVSIELKSSSMDDVNEALVEVSVDDELAVAVLVADVVFRLNK